MTIEIDSITMIDCIDGLKNLREASIDLVVTDPPFGIAYNPQASVFNRKSEFVIEGYQEAPENYYEFSYNWLSLVSKALKEKGSIYVYLAWNKVFDVLKAIDDLDLFVRNHLIWRKTFGIYCSIRWTTAHYHLLHIVKAESIDPTFVKVYKKHPKKRGLYHYPEDVLEHNTEYHHKTMKVGTKLPSKQVELLIRTSSHRGDTVLDPFVGNGTVPIAARKLKRHYIGFEINQNTIPILKKNNLRILRRNMN